MKRQLEEQRRRDLEEKRMKEIERKRKVEESRRLQEEETKAKIIKKVDSKSRLDKLAGKFKLIFLPDE